MRKASTYVAAAIALGLLGGRLSMGQELGRPAPALTTHINMQVGDAQLLAGLGAAPHRAFVEIPGSQEFSGELIVRPKGAVRGAWRAKPRAMARALDRVSPLITRTSTITEQFVVKVPAGSSEDELSAFLMATGDYEYAEPNWTLYPAATTPNDPLYSSSWQHSRIQSAAAWDLVTGSDQVIVAVCDSGCDTDHPDLQASYVPGFNSRRNRAEVDGGEVEDINGHGTFVAGCAAAIGNNGTGVVGAGWNFKIMPIRVTDNSNGTANPFDLTQGAIWAAQNGAQIVNVSFSGGTSSSNQAAAIEVKEAGGLLFWAAGNDNSLLPDVDRPDYVIVASTTSSDNKSGFSNFGPPVDVAAPGSGVRSTRNGGSYGTSSGTSFASPIAAGVGAMIFAANPGLHPTDVQEILSLGADDLGPAGEDDSFGAGRVNTFNSVQIALGFTPRAPLPFADSFETAALGELSWVAISGAEVETDPAPGGSLALRLDGTDSIESNAMLAKASSGQIVVFSFMARREGVEAGESLLAEYRDAAGAWQPAATLTSVGPDAGAYQRVEAVIAEADLTNQLAIRFTAGGSDATDVWYIDDVSVSEFTGAVLPLGDSFESGELVATRWSESSGASVDAGGVDGSLAMSLDPGDSATTQLVDATVFPQSLYLSFRVRGEGAGGADAMLVEYRDIQGNFASLATVSGPDTGAFELRVLEMPFLSLHDGLAIRFIGQGPGGVWRVDDLLLSLEAPAPDCPADLAEPFGSLDFVDVLAFLSAFSAQAPEADLSEPFGSFDFADVLAFLSSFGAGCP